MADLEAVLSADGIYKSYGGTAVLRDVSVRVHAGEVVFLVGPSGCGKSTFLRLLADLEPRDSGTLALDGRARESFDAPRWRARVSYVPQSRARLPDSPVDLFRRAKNFAGRTHTEVRTDFAEVARSVGLDRELIEKPWSQLSGGQCQRASVAIAIALEPRVLLLDEATSACDPDATTLVEKAVRKCGAAVLWVSHDSAQPARVGGRVVPMVPVV